MFMSEKDETNSENGRGEEQEEEEDPTALTLTPQHVVEALKKFEQVRERKALEEIMGNAKTKKKKTEKVEDEAARANREAIK